MVKKVLAVAVLLSVLVFSAQAQESYTVQISVRNNGVLQHIGEDFYVTGAFNRWEPGERLAGKFPAVGESVLIRIPEVRKGFFEYKFTRGNWGTVMSTNDGALKQPLNADIQSDTVLYVSIDGWRDDFPLSTASPQVHVLDSAFYFPSLDVKRRVWIYLPEGYATSSDRYPVIYMHDGEDLFDEATSKGRIGPVEWYVDEAIDGSPHDAIVVAIAQAEDIPQRQNEYFVYPNARFKNPVGTKYMHDIVHTLKPHVDQHFRTRSDKKHTAMVGSSAGGLFTFYAGLAYPEVFGTLGVFSPSFWMDQENIVSAVSKIKSKKSVRSQRYFFYGGGNENREKPDGSYVRMHDDLQAVSDLLADKVDHEVEILINPEGRHGAWYWQQAFPSFFEWWNHQIEK